MRTYYGGFRFFLLISHYIEYGYFSSFFRYLSSLVVNWINVGKLPIIINSGVCIIFFADALLVIIVHSNDSGKNIKWRR